MTAIHKKELALVGFAAIYTIVFFGVAASFFRGQQEWSIQMGSVLGIAGILWAAIMALTSGLVGMTKGMLPLLTCIPAAALVIFGGFSIGAWIGAAILLILTTTAQRTIAQEIEGHIKIRIMTVFSLGVRMLLFGVLLSFIVLAVPAVQRAVTSGNVAIPEAYLVQVANVFSPILENTLPIYSKDKTVDEMFIEQHQNVAAAREELAGQLNIRVAGTETGPVLIARATNEYIKRNAQGDGLIVTGIVVAVALIAVRTFVPIAAAVALPCIALLFWILKKAGVVKLIEREVPVEFVEL